MLMDAPGPIQVIFTVDTFTRATLGGGLLRHIKYAASLRTRGIQFRWLTLESDVDAAFQEQYAIQVRIVPMPEGLPLHRRRELLLGEALHEASLLPAGQRIVTTDSCGVSGSTIRQLWRARLRGIPATHNTSMIPGPLPESWLGNLRLRLACALQGRSAQALVTEAVDRLLDAMPDLAPPASAVGTQKFA